MTLARRIEAGEDANAFACSIVFNGQTIDVEAFYNWEPDGNDPEIITIEAVFINDEEITHLMELVDWDRSYVNVVLHPVVGWQDPIRTAMFGHLGRWIDGKYHIDKSTPIEHRFEWSCSTLGGMIEAAIYESTEHQERVRDYYARDYD